MSVSRKGRPFSCGGLPALAVVLHWAVLMISERGSVRASTTTDLTSANAAFLATGQRTLKAPERPKETSTASPVNTRARGPLPKKEGPMQPFLDETLDTSSSSSDSQHFHDDDDKKTAHRDEENTYETAAAQRRGRQKVIQDNTCRDDSSSECEQTKERQKLTQSRQRPKTLCALNMGSLWVSVAREGGPASTSVVITQARPLTREEARIWAETDDEERPVLLKTWQAAQSDKARRAAWLQYHKQSLQSGTPPTEYQADEDVIDSLRRQGWTRLFAF